MNIERISIFKVSATFLLRQLASLVLQTSNALLKISKRYIFWLVVHIKFHPTSPPSALRNRMGTDEEEGKDEKQNSVTQ